MNDKEINDLTVELEKLRKQVNKDATPDSFIRKSVWAFGIFFMTLIFYGGVIYRDIQILKEKAVPKAEWLEVKYKANASYNKVFEIPYEYQTRGGGTNEQ